jgi:hypothetical protein
MKFSDIAYRLGSSCGELVSSCNIKLNASSAVSATHFNYCLKSFLDSEQPFLLGRLGSTESRLIRAFLTRVGHTSPLLARHAAQTAGMGPQSEHHDIVSLYLDNLLDFNFLAEWPCPGHSSMKKYMAKQARTPFFYNLEFLNPLSLALVHGLKPSDLWLQSLIGKRILVVHPFEASFRASTTRQLGTFENELLPDMSYVCFSPPVTFGSYDKPYSFMALLNQAQENLSRVASGSSFDIALVAAGGYGLPIASFLYRKQIAKKVLHVGGVLQLYFGVIGNRWLTSPYSRMYSQYQNLHKWSRVVDEQSLGLAKTVESGCYV